MQLTVEARGNLGAGLTDSCKLPDKVLGTEPVSSRSALYHYTISLPSSSLLLKNKLYNNIEPINQVSCINSFSLLKIITI